MSKVAIISGAAGNLGQAVVKKFINEGYNVVGTVSSNDAGPAGKDNGLDRFAVDLTDEKATGEFIANAINKYKTIDVAVLTVGGFASGRISETSTSEIYGQYRLNFETAYNVARPVFVHMLQQGSGRIFLVGSRPGLEAKSSKGTVAYGLAKSMIFRLAELMNEEAKGTNVVTTVIVPGSIDTAQNRKAMPGADFSSWVTADAIADAICFYSSDEAAAIREPVIKLYNNS